MKRKFDKLVLMALGMAMMACEASPTLLPREIAAYSGIPYEQTVYIRGVRYTGFENRTPNDVTGTCKWRFAGQSGTVNMPGELTLAMTNLPQTLDLNCEGKYTYPDQVNFNKTTVFNKGLSIPTTYNPTLTTNLNSGIESGLGLSQAERDQLMRQQGVQLLPSAIGVNFVGI